MSWVIFAAYLVGAVLGRVASSHSSLNHVWPVVVRTQVLVAAVALSVTSVWRIDSIDSVLWPLLMVLAIVILWVYSFVTFRGSNRPARAALQAWGANANTAYFVVPVGAALAGPVGASAAVLMDRMAVALYSWWIHLLRKGAPRPQKRSSNVVDQAPLMAVALGLALHLVGPAPEWTATVTLIAAPVLAASGAAIFVGSVLHPSQRIDPRPGVRRWLTLIVVRIAVFAPIAIWAPTPSLRVVAVLCALSIPAFIAAQLSVVYGYAEPAVAAASRYGWIVGAAGLLVALQISV